jgi:hypothetical protein
LPVYVEMNYIVGMTRGFLLALLLAALTACKKHEPALTPKVSPSGEPGAAIPEAASASEHPTSLPAIPVKIVAPENGNTDAILGRLSMELRKYVVRTRSAPKSFEEFAANTHLEAPAPPEGRKYAISRGTVVLVNR